MIDGKNINQISIDELMANTAFVFQDTFMINDTIFKNVLMELDRTKDEVIDACKKAKIHEFIMSLEKGYDTIMDADQIIVFDDEKK